MVFLSQLRPISLCNVAYKILTKTMANNRLKDIMPMVEAPNQNSFVLGRDYRQYNNLSGGIAFYATEKV